MNPLPVLASLVLTTFSVAAQFTPLTRAIRTETFSKVIENLTPQLVNQPDRGGYHPLTYAVFTGNPKLVEALLKADAKPNITENNGRSPLSVAANCGNPEIIALLHRYGATLPQGKDSEPVGRAAVHSGSPETLSALFKLYPGVSIERGWPPVLPTMIGEVVPPKQTEGAFSHAIDNSLFETAVVLAEKAPDLSHRNSLGQNALQMAASHARCPVQVVEALLKRGMKPTAPFLSNRHIEPGTALDLAAARGSEEHVQAMLKYCDPKSDLQRIARSAYVASAHNHPRTVQLLLQFIKGSIWGTEKWLEDFEKKLGKSQAAQPGQHNPIHDPEFEQILPNPKPGNLDRTLLGTLAIISAPRLGNTASLLTAFFSDTANLTVVERDQIEKAVLEQNLARFQAKDSPALHRSLNLIPAEYVLLVTSKRVANREVLQFTLIQTRTGLVLNHLVTPPDPKPTELENLARSFLPHFQKASTSQISKINLSVTPLKPEVPTGPSLTLCQQINLALPVLASRTPGCALLERGQMTYLENEQALGASGTYWSGSWVIDGGLRSPDSGKAVLTLRATRPRDGKTHQVECPLSTEDLRSNLNQGWQNLITQLDNRNATKITQLPAKEVAILTKHANWLFNADYHEEAISLIDSCLILDGESEALQLLSLRARLASLPLSARVACRHLIASPRSLEPEKKFPFVRHFARYFALADTALHYLALIDGSDSSGSSNRPYHQLVSNALQELVFFRVMMDDSEVIKTHGPEIQSLDLQINQLTDLYLERMKGHRTEFYTLERFLGGDFGYCSQCNPVLLQKISARLVALSEANKIPSGRGLKNLISAQFRDSVRNGHPTAPWSQLFERLYPESREPRLPAITRTDRLKRISKLMSNWEKLTPGENKIIGSDSPSLAIWGNRTPAPEGGLESYFLKDHSSLTGTAEFRRMYGLYRSAYLISKEGVHDATLSRYLKPSQSKDLMPISIEGWKSIEPLLTTNPKATPKTKELLRQIIIATKSPDSPPLRPSPETGPGKPADRSMLQLGPPDFLLPAPTSSRYPVQFLHPGESTIKDEQLWIPVSLTPREALQTSPQNLIPAIHVIDLKSNKLRTIPLPRETPRSRPRKVGARIQYVRVDRRILIGETKAYYLANSYNTPSKVFCIDRSSLVIKEVKLPYPSIQAAPIEIVDDQLYLSLLSENKSNIVIRIKGTTVSSPLVSTLRKPARTPLDHPELRINHLMIESGNLVALSVPDFVFEIPESSKAATLDSKTGEWKSASLEETKDLMKKRQASLDEYHFGRYSVISGGKTFFPFHQKDFSVLTFNSLRNRLLPFIGPVMPAFKQGFVHLPIQVDRVSSPAFDLPLKAFSESGKQSPDWQTANDLLTKKQFQARVIGRTKTDFYLTLHRDEIGFPAIWKLPASALEKELSREAE